MAAYNDVNELCKRLNDTHVEEEYEVIGGDEAERFEVFYEFIKSSEHSTYCVAGFTRHSGDTSYTWRESGHDGHAEKQIIDWFRNENRRRKSPVTLTLYLTRAPCGKPGNAGRPATRSTAARLPTSSYIDGGCAQKLVDLLDEYRDLTIDIITVGAYQENHMGLKLLMVTQGITIRAFTDTDWVSLERILGLNNTQRCITKEVDKRIAKTNKRFSNIANGRYRRERRDQSD